MLSYSFSVSNNMSLHNMRSKLDRHLEDEALMADSRSRALAPPVLPAFMDKAEYFSILTAYAFSIPILNF